MQFWPKIFVSYLKYFTNWKKSSAVNEPFCKFPRNIFRISEIILGGNFDLALGLCAHARRKVFLFKDKEKLKNLVSLRSASWGEIQGFKLFWIYPVLQVMILNLSSVSWNLIGRQFFDQNESSSDSAKEQFLKNAP